MQISLEAALVGHRSSIFHLPAGTSCYFQVETSRELLLWRFFWHGLGAENSPGWVQQSETSETGRWTSQPGPKWFVLSTFYPILVLVCCGFPNMFQQSHLVKPHLKSHLRFWVCPKTGVAKIRAVIISPAIFGYTRVSEQIHFHHATALWTTVICAMFGLLIGLYPLDRT